MMDPDQRDDVEQPSSAAPASTVSPMATTTTTTTTTTAASTDSPSQVEMAGHLRRVFIIFLASVVELIAASHVCDVSSYCEKEYGFAVAVGVVAVIASLTFLIVLQFRPSLPMIAVQIFSLFMMILWTTGAGINTFRAPFVNTGNGFFASWIAFIESSRLAYLHLPLLRQFVDKISRSAVDGSPTHQIIAAIFASSVVELVAAATLCDSSSHCEKEQGWAVAVGCISCLVSLVCLVAPKLEKFHLYVSALLALIWVPGVGVLTFDSPFVGTGNGYFSSWIAFVSTMYWFYVTLSTSHPKLSFKRKTVEI